MAERRANLAQCLGLQQQASEIKPGKRAKFSDERGWIAHERGATGQPLKQRQSSGNDSCSFVLSTAKVSTLEENVDNKTIRTVVEV
jgi:hypothetical protein